MERSKPNILNHDGLTVTQNVAAKMEKARQDFREGKAISLKTHKDVDSYFESM
jgi:hypothetical protein